MAGTHISGPLTVAGVEVVNSSGAITADIQATAGSISATELAGTLDLSAKTVTLGEVLQGSNVGTAEAGVLAVEYGDGSYHKTELTMIGLNLGAIAGAAAESTGALMYTLPAGAIVVHAAYMTIGLTNTDGNIDADTPDLGVGTVVAAGANATLNLTAGAENIITGQTANNVTGTAEVKTVGDQVLVIEAADAHTVYLNVADTWAGAETTGVVAAGTVTLIWSFVA